MFGLFSIEQGNAQVSQQWAARYHYYIDDAANDIAVDDSGNVYVTGGSHAQTPNGEQPDYATIKYNSAGVQQWVQRYNGPGNHFDAATSIAVDDSGNVYVTGTSNRFGFPQQENYDFATIKYNTSGIQQWVRRYNGPGADAATAGIVIDAQGYVYVAGRSEGISTGSDYTIIKYNANGDSLWVRRYDSGGNDNSYDYPIAMAVDISGNVYLTGAVGLNNFPAPDWATVKWNSQGVFQWVQRYNGPGNGSDYPKNIAVDNSGNVYVIGYVWGNNNTDYTTIKYNSSGVQEWVAFYNNSFGGGAWSVITDDSGNVYVTGQISAGGANVDYLTTKYSTNGIQQWAARYNGPANYIDIPCCVKLDTKGNVYVTGYATVSSDNRDYCTIKYNNSGVQQWVIFYSGPNSYPYDFPKALAVDNSENVYITGSSGGFGNVDYATVKYSQTIGISQTSSDVPKEFNLFQNYPNPFNPSSKIKFQISKLSDVTLNVFDIRGREILILVDEVLKPGTYEAEISRENYPSGIYFYRLQTEKYNQTLKMSLIK